MQNNINIIAPINQLGYGVASLNIVKSLSSMANVALFPIGSPSDIKDEDVPFIKKALENAQLPDFKAPCIRVWHQHDMSQFVGKGQQIAFPFFELTKFSEREKHHLNNVDKIFVASQWAKNICLSELSQSEDNIIVMPLGVDTDIFKPASNVNQDKKTIFFNCGKWEKRKGHDILPIIFDEAFDADDNVELWMMNHNPFLEARASEKWKNLYIDSKNGHKVRFIDRAKTQEEVYNIMAKVDCGIFPSRAEGWNLELLEVMSCGKPVIATNYSAHTEFCNDENAHLIQIDNLEPADDGIWFNGSMGDWAKIEHKQISEFAKYMKHIYDLKQNNQLQINTAGINTSKKFSWDSLAKRITSNV